MKPISELTEVEILGLKDEDILLMINLKKAEEGIQLVKRPIAPTYFDVPEKDLTAYSCQLFGDMLVFVDITECMAVLEVIAKAKTKYSLQYEYNRASGDAKYISSKLGNAWSGEWNTTTSTPAYSQELYDTCVDRIAQNTKLKEQYEKETKGYEDQLDNARWIETEINTAVAAVRDKYWKLESYCKKFKYDYLPLSGGSITVAMNFLDKAYSLTQEQQDYVSANYQTF